MESHVCDSLRWVKELRRRRQHRRRRTLGYRSAVEKTIRVSCRWARRVFERQPRVGARRTSGGAPSAFGGRSRSPARPAISLYCALHSASTPPHHHPPRALCRSIALHSPIPFCIVLGCPRAVVLSPAGTVVCDGPPANRPFCSAHVRCAPFRPSNPPRPCPSRHPTTVLTSASRVAERSNRSSSVATRPAPNLRPPSCAESRAQFAQRPCGDHRSPPPCSSPA